MPIRKRRNLFYVLLVPVGAAFVVTAFAYWVMAFQAVRPASAERPAAVAADGGHPLKRWLRANGDEALGVELAILGILTVAAIATDSWWDRPAASDDTLSR
jgi:hypothetical protein